MFKKLNITIALFINLFLFNCSPYTQEIEYALKYENKSRLIDIIENLSLKRAGSMSDQNLIKAVIGLINIEISDGYHHFSVADLQYGIECWERALLYLNNPNITNRLNIGGYVWQSQARIKFAAQYQSITEKLNRIINDKENLDELILFFNSDSLSNISNYDLSIQIYTDQVQQLFGLVNYRAPFNYYKYLGDRIYYNPDDFDTYLEQQKSLMNIMLQVDKAPKSNSFFIFSKLVSFGGLKMLKEYKYFFNRSLEFLNAEQFTNQDTRLLALSSIGSNSHHMNEKNQVKNYLENYYNKFDLNISNDINNIYEAYIAHTLGIGPFQILDIQSNINNLSSEYGYQFIIDNVDDYQLKDKLITKLSSNNSQNHFFLSISIDSLNTFIDAETFNNKIDSKYQIDKQVVPNSEYNNAVDNVVYWEHEVARIRTANAQCDTKKTNADGWAGVAEAIAIAACKQPIPIADLNQARQKLSKTPTTKEINIYQDYSFNHIGHAINGNIDITLSITYLDKTVDIKLDDEFVSQTSSKIGVAINDYYNHKETSSPLPTKLLLKDFLITRLTNKIAATLSYKSLSKYFNMDNLFNKEYIIEQFSEHPNFLSMFTYSDPDSAPLNLKLSNKKNNFKKLKDAIKHSAGASCQIVAYNNDFDNTSSGSGYFISEDGFLVTNLHVIADKQNFLLLREIDNKIVVKNAVVLYSDDSYDLALLKTNDLFSNSNIISVNPDINLEMGDEIVYVGYPSVLITKGSEPFTSQGIISQIKKDEYNNAKIVLFDITANPGSSGSAVIIKMTGELIGTLTWGFGRTITVDDLFTIIGGGSKNIKERQIAGTSAHTLYDFLSESGLIIKN